MSEEQPSSFFDKTIAIACLLLLVFASPFLDWWSQSGLPWFVPYFFWGGIIILTAFVQVKCNKHDL